MHVRVDTFGNIVRDIRAILFSKKKSRNEYREITLYRNFMKHNADRMDIH